MIIRAVRSLRGTRVGSEVFYTPNGYSYHKNTSRNGITYYKCTQYYSYRCTGRGMLRAIDGIFEETKHHNHRPQRYAYLLARMRLSMLAEASNHVWNAPSQMVRRVTVQFSRRFGIPREVAAQLHFNRLRSSIRRYRMAHFPPIPHTLEELSAALENYPSLTETLDAQDTVYAGSFGNEEDGTKCIVISSARMRSFMGRVKEVFVDGTFSVCFTVPHHRQIYSIVTVWRNHVIPLTWIIMQKKSQECYETALRGMRVLVPNFRPKIVHCDFEAAQLNAWEIVYNPEAIFGCYFHYVDAILRKALCYGMQPLIRNDEAAESLLRSFCALPLLPPGTMGLGLLALAGEADSLDLMDDFREFFQYFHTTWIPLAEVLCVFGAEHRTNNVCESQNRMISRELGRVHAMTYDLFGAFVRMEENAVQDLYCLYAGFSPSRQRKASAILNDRAIRNLSSDLVQGSISGLHFLHAASHRMQNEFDRAMQLVEETHH